MHDSKGIMFVPYRDGEKRDRYYIIDFPIRQIELNDFIKKTEVTDLIFINSTLKVDEYYTK